MPKVIFYLIFIFVSFDANAWSLIGPKNYQECIIETMKGVTSDVAAKEIKKACRDQFPKPMPQEEELPDDALKKIEGKASVDGYGKYVCKLFNGNSDWSISSIQIVILDEESKKTRTYKADYTKSHALINGELVDFTIGPLAQGEFAFEPFELPVKRSWEILRATGIKVKN